MKALIVVFLVVVTAGAVAPQRHYTAFEQNDHAVMLYCKDGSDPALFLPKDFAALGHPERLPMGVMVVCK